MTPEEEKKEKRKQYDKEYYKNNKEKIQAVQRKWRAANPGYRKNNWKNLTPEQRETIRVRMRQWRAANPDKVKAIADRNYKKHRQKMIDRAGKYYKDNKEKLNPYYRKQVRKWRNEHRDKVKEINKSYYEKNKDKINEKAKRKRAIEKLLLQTAGETPTEEPQLHANGRNQRTDG